jgi:hypothetical protein
MEAYALHVIGYESQDLWISLITFYSIRQSRNNYDISFDVSFRRNNSIYIRRSVVDFCVAPIYWYSENRTVRRNLNILFCYRKYNT